MRNIPVSLKSCTIDLKEKERQRIAQDVQRFLASGGQINVLHITQRAERIGRVGILEYP